MKINNIFSSVNKKIFFQPSRKNAKNFPNFPEPAYQNIPEWYKKQKLFSNNENNFIDANKKSIIEKKPFHFTYKMCTPLVDTLTSGYVIKTSADISIFSLSESEYIPHISWNVSWNILDIQDDQVLGTYPVPHGYYKNIYRWQLDNKIITPNGYSLWITHPSHRYDLPFLTINGFVDTDKHPNTMLLPFFLRYGFEGVIPQGTPIAQIIPIKRENWVSEQKDFDSLAEEIEKDFIGINFLRVYKNKFWSKKSYK